MQAMVLERVAAFADQPVPLRPVDLPRPDPAPAEVRIRVEVCGVCHTELDEIEGRTPPDRLPRVLGHQVVGIIDACGAAVATRRVGERVGVGWIHDACGECAYCGNGAENLCPAFRATGRDADGGYAEWMTVPASSVFPIPDAFSPAQAAPLLCAGAIGCRSLRLTGLADGQPLGLTGFGASAHLVLQMARSRFPHSPVLVFARDPASRELARSLGAAWAGDTGDHPPTPPHAIIDTTPAWTPVVAALAVLAPGGRLVINAIRKESGDQQALLDLDYPRHLWMEKEIKSVANVCRRDIAEALALAADIPLRPVIREYPLADANRALEDIRASRTPGAKVLRIRD